MTPQNQDEAPTPRFTSRQKITAAVIVVILLVVVWQVIGLFGGESSAPPPVQNKMPAQRQAVQTVQPGTQPAAQQPSAAPPTPGAVNTARTVTVNNPPPPTDPNKLTVSQQQQTIMAQQQDTQKQYVDTINQLQMLKLQRDIDETKQSIAAARLATATAEKNISDLFTKPSQAQLADFNKAMGTGTNGDKIPPPPVQDIPQIPYTVISVSMRLGHWTAVIGLQGKMYSVSVGDVLPPDGSQVVAISKNGVVLQKSGTKRRIGVVNSL